MFRLFFLLCLVVLTDLSASKIQLIEFSNYTKNNFDDFVLDETNSDSSPEAGNLYVKTISSDNEELKIILKDNGRNWGHGSFLMDVFLQVNDIQTKYAVILYNSELTIKVKFLESFEGNLNLEIETNTNGVVRYCVNGELRPEDNLYFSESENIWYSPSDWENRVKMLEYSLQKLQKDFNAMRDRFQRELDRQRDREQRENEYRRNRNWEGYGP